ncbi:adenine nucleotide translocase lysine N-methyltransferase isoform 5 [Gallus gallus]|uniref:adenine nucleotide translocase lysine N-methyltransferase isoform 5 n=1 Tax=Gallus gallus TaxID=9031 RepID=UPI001D066479|nr:adenine nucleotide translocase lysine N-methyltransferase isoform 5 [Gallus gallus]
MDAEALDELAGQLQGEALGGRGLLQLAATTGLAAYAVWAAVLMPGFRRVPLHLQVPYVPSSAQQVANVMGLLRGRTGKTADLGSGDGRLANLSDCYNVIVFLAPSVKPPLAAKLLAELPDEARVVAGRFPFPSWTPSSTIGQGLEQAWAYDMKEVRRAARRGTAGCAL